jgi:hypothetical protein
VANRAGQSGSLSILQWLFEHGCDQHAGTVSYWTAYGGSLHVLEWLQEQGTQFNADTMEDAAWNGQLQVHLVTYVYYSTQTGNSVEL